MNLPKNWTFYELFDYGNKRKLERFGNIKITGKEIELPPIQFGAFA